jgi:hypothetical protein
MDATHYVVVNVVILVVVHVHMFQQEANVQVAQHLV